MNVLIPPCFPLSGCVLIGATNEMFCFRRARVKRQIRMAEMLDLVLDEQIDGLGK